MINDHSFIVKFFYIHSRYFRGLPQVRIFWYNAIITLQEAYMDRLPVYLDHAATTPPDEAVILAMTQCMRDIPYNASAAYSAAGAARRIHRLCRRQIGDMLLCPPDEIIFTSGGTEANNWVIHSFAGCHAVISAIEHHSVLEAARKADVRATIVMPDSSGFIHPEAIAAALTPETRLICLQAANNETGVIQNIKEVYAIAKPRGIHLHVDAVQAFGHIPLHATNCDSMSLSAHKIYGPRGIGALRIRTGAAVKPLLWGGKQESGLRAGTENTPAICGFHVAAKLAQEDMAQRAVRQKELLDPFIQQICASIPGARLLGSDRSRLPGIAALHLPGIPSEYAIAKLDMQGILVSGGAACASHDAAPSHVYSAMGLTDKEAACVLRISIGRHTTSEELTYTANALCALKPQPMNQSISR